MIFVSRRLLPVNAWWDYVDEKLMLLLSVIKYHTCSGVCSKVEKSTETGVRRLGQWGKGMGGREELGLKRHTAKLEGKEEWNQNNKG